MRILVTGSSGQIGTNLALRLLEDGHEVFGVDKRPNAWVGNAFPTLLQDLAGRGHKIGTRSRWASGSAPALVQVTPGSV